MQKNLSQRWITLGFGVTLFISALTGFAQMPIFKRYYIADLPGLGWLAQFYTTYWLHYVSAIALIAVSAYLATDYLLQQRKPPGLPSSGLSAAQCWYSSWPPAPCSCIATFRDIASRRCWWWPWISHTWAWWSCF
jgi:hypothetical protein